MRKAQNEKFVRSRNYNFYNNFHNKTKDCCAYYSHRLFCDSRKNHNWYFAENSNLYFGYRRKRGHRSLELFPNKRCFECGQVYFNTQCKVFIDKCCKPILDGKMKPLKPLTPLLEELIMSDPIHMLKYSTYYNNACSMCSTGVANDSGQGGFQHNYHGNHAVTIKGRTYHTIVEQHRSKPSSMIGYMFFDEIMKPNESVAHKISGDYLLRIFADISEYNCIADEIYYVKQQYNNTRRSILFNGNCMSQENIQEFVVSVNKSTNFFDIGLLRMDAINERVIRFVDKDSRSSTIPLYSSLRHPLAYPLFFPWGELGWGKDNGDIQHSKIRMPEYAACRLLRLEKNMEEEDMKLPCLLDNCIKMKTNRFQCMPRLAQVMAVDDVSTMVDTKLRYTADNQDIITAGYRDDVNPEDVGK